MDTLLSETHSVCLKQTQMPGSAALFTDFLYQFERVSRFYPHPPDVAKIADAARGIQLPPEHRKALVAALRAQNASGGDATAENLNLLAELDTVVVATGQQVGLYGGPVFALYKALTAIELARNLRAGGQRAVAVFWMATEDHDLAEIDHTWLLDAHDRAVRVHAAATHHEGEPVGAVAIEDTALPGLRAHLDGLACADEAAGLAAESYPDGVSFRDGFRGLLNRLVRHDGLIFLDPMDPAIRRLAAPLFERALDEGDDLNRLLLERCAALEDSGYHTQVRVTDETSLLFRFDEDRRIAMKRVPNGYEQAGRMHTVEDLRKELASDPGRFSPSALLRPVTQDFLLPTAAYVAGPAEIAYLAQAGVLYERLLGRMPVVLPRLSLTVLDSRAERLLNKYGLTAADCFQAEGDLRSRIAAQLVPAAIEKQLKASEALIEKALADAHGPLASFDPTLGQALDSSSKKMRYQFGKIRTKAAAESLRRDSRAEGDAAYLANLIYPEGNPQERVFSVMSFLARYGDGFVDAVRAAVRPACLDHQILTL
ncbi:MAG TPA: bacillithiol biosynthesis cysteine-adding enzyme BshC [Bryobacterales bacterium]|nr:bacillithiol biosynthesis cysteine-adding enzyme BshC [Bryobacterales bacterium]